MDKDPAFLFYPGDASDDTQFMNRLERGCYFDLLKAQKKHRKFSIQLIQKVLGRDFETCWPSIELVLQKEGDLYFIGWVHDSMENRAAHAAKQKKRIQDYWDKKKATGLNQTNTTEQPNQERGNSLENENAIENENDFKNKKESLSKLEIFGALFSDDLFVEQLTRGHKGKNPEEAFEQCYTHHISGPSPPTEVWEWKQKLNTWLSIAKPDGKKHIKQNSNLTHSASLAEDFARRHGAG